MKKIIFIALLFTSCKVQFFATRDNNMIATVSQLQAYSDSVFSALATSPNTSFDNFKDGYVGIGNQLNAIHYTDSLRPGAKPILMQVDNTKRILSRWCTYHAIKITVYQSDAADFGDQLHAAIDAILISEKNLNP